MHARVDHIMGWVDNRRTYFEKVRREEQGTVQRERVLKQFETFLKGKQICEVIPEDVVNFLIFKEMEGKGRTIVHKQTCSQLGTQNLNGCKKEECGLRHAYDSLRLGYFEKLKALFEEEGLAGKWNPQRREGNPVKSVKVQQYMDFVKKEQGLAGITPKQA